MMTYQEACEDFALFSSPEEEHNAYNYDADYDDTFLKQEGYHARCEAFDEALSLWSCGVVDSFPKF